MLDLALSTTVPLAENKAALEAIDSAIFAVCLDANDGAGTPKALSQAMLHGLGPFSLIFFVFPSSSSNRSLVD